MNRPKGDRKTVNVRPLLGAQVDEADEDSR